MGSHAPTGCRYLWALLGVTGSAYLGSLGLAGVLFYFFKPADAGDCSFNVTMITFTLILGLVMTGVSMTPNLVRSCLLCQPGVFSAERYAACIQWHVCTLSSVCHQDHEHDSACMACLT